METNHFLYLFRWRKASLFFGHTSPLLPLLSGTAHSECDVRKLLGEEDFSRAAPWPLDLQFRQALAAGGPACELTVPLGPQGTEGIRYRGPSC